MLDESIIVQVDATVIAGILILLTIGSFRFEGLSETILQKLGKKGKLSPYLIVLVLSIPFSLSVIVIVIRDFFNFLYPNDPLYGTNSFYLVGAEVLTGVGFSYIFWVVYKIANTEEKLKELKEPGESKRSLLGRVKDYFCRK